MNHQPFEEWLFTEEPLEQEQNQKLKAHLEDCAHCSQLEKASRAAEYRLRSAPMMAPAPGFAQRWQAQLATRKQQALLARQRMITWIVLGIFGGAALALLGYLGMQQITAFTSFEQLLFSLGRNLSQIITQLNDLREILSNIFRYLPFTIPLPIWFLAGTNIAVLCLVWVYSLWRIASPKGAKSK
jgi:hypothetical protein